MNDTATITAPTTAAERVAWLKERLNVGDTILALTVPFQPDYQGQRGTVNPRTFEESDQNHGEVRVYADFPRIGNPDTTVLFYVTSWEAQDTDADARVAAVQALLDRANNDLEVARRNSAASSTRHREDVLALAKFALAAKSSQGWCDQGYHDFIINNLPSLHMHDTFMEAALDGVEIEKDYEVTLSVDLTVQSTVTIEVQVSVEDALNEDAAMEEARSLFDNSPDSYFDYDDISSTMRRNGIEIDSYDVQDVTVDSCDES